MLILADTTGGRIVAANGVLLHKFVDSARAVHLKQRSVQLEDINCGKFDYFKPKSTSFLAVTDPGPYLFSNNVGLM